MLSNHRRLQLHEIYAGREPDSIIAHHGSVVMNYGEHRVVVRRNDWRVYMPANEAEADYVQRLGVGDRAKAAVASREAKWGGYRSPDFDLAMEAFQLRMRRGAA